MVDHHLSHRPISIAETTQNWFRQSTAVIQAVIQTQSPEQVPKAGKGGKG